MVLQQGHGDSVPERSNQADHTPRAIGQWEELFGGKLSQLADGTVSRHPLA